MQYHAPTRQFTVSARDLEAFAASMRYAIRKVREAGGLPLEGGSPTRLAHAACQAEKAILDGSRALGIDLGAERDGILDVRDAG